MDSARRVLKVLLLFTEKGPELSVEEIAHSIGISIPSAYRFVSLLREMDMVEDNGKGTYVLSPRVLLLARSAEQAFPASKVLHPFVERLSKATGEAALVIRRVGDFATRAEISQPEHTIRLSFEPGQIMVLAELPDIVSRGWSKSEAEVDEGVWAVAAPIKVADRWWPR
ncbi:helix-turn-helix domain-containing protein [Streptomyces scopuliridis]